MRSLGGKATLSKKTIRYKGEYRDYWRVYWRLNCSLPLSIQRKQTKTKRMPTYNHRIVSYIEPLSKLECGDITVNHPEHNYVSDSWIVTGNSGKTFAGSAEFCYHITGKYPDWWTGRRFEGKVKGRIVAKDFSYSVKEVITPELNRWLKGISVKVHRNPMGVVVSYVLPNGNSFDIMSYEQHVDLFEGWNGHIVWFDEPPPRDKYVACRRGLVDNGGIVIMTMTPLKEPWIYDELFLKEGVFSVTVDMRDNPHLKEEDIAAYEKDLTPDEREARIHGKFLHLQGLVHKRFDQNVHVIPKREIQGPVYFAMDPHDRTPTCAIWAKIDKFGDVFIVDEIELAETIPHLALEFAKKERNNNYYPLARYIDPNYGRKHLEIITGETIQETFEKHGIRTILANDDGPAGRMKIDEHLQYDTAKPISLTNRPKLYIFDSCVRTIHGLTHFIWDDWTNKTSMEKDPKEKPKDLHKHFPDCIRYLLMGDLRFEPPEVYRPNYDVYGTSK